MSSEFFPKSTYPRQEKCHLSFSKFRATLLLCTSLIARTPQNGTDHQNDSYSHRRHQLNIRLNTAKTLAVSLSVSCKDLDNCTIVRRYLTAETETKLSVLTFILILTLILIVIIIIIIIIITCK